MESNETPKRTTLATFHLQHQDDATGALVDSPLSVVHLDHPALQFQFVVERHGDVVRTDGAGSPASFTTPGEAMVFAMELSGWAHVVRAELAASAR